jgi:hypothetical protein
MGLQDFNELVAGFLARQKEIARRPRWQVVQHEDYAAASTVVAVSDSRVLRGRLILTAHKVRLPPKYGFSLLFRNERILALDVNPGRSHRNLFVPSKVAGTHWQRWPKMEAEEDYRDQTFAVWMRDFLRQANVANFVVKLPPRGVQLRLLDDDDSKGRRS